MQFWGYEIEHSRQPGSHAARWLVVTEVQARVNPGEEMDWVQKVALRQVLQKAWQA